MNPKAYRTPLNASTRPRCPVCREAVYSRSGIHPQCAVRQSDPPRAKAKSRLPEQVVPAEGAIDPDVAIAASTAD